MHLLACDIRLALRICLANAQAAQSVTVKEAFQRSRDQGSTAFPLESFVNRHR